MRAVLIILLSFSLFACDSSGSSDTENNQTTSTFDQSTFDNSTFSE